MVQVDYLTRIAMDLLCKNSFLAFMTIKYCCLKELGK